MKKKALVFLLSLSIITGLLFASPVGVQVANADDPPPDVPQIVSQTPVNGAVIQDRWDGVVTITYDQPVALGDGYIDLLRVYTDAGSAHDAMVSFMRADASDRVSLSADGLTVTVDFDQNSIIDYFSGDLLNEENNNYKEHYWIKVEGGAIVSAADYTVNAEYCGDHNWNVYVQATPPGVASCDPYIGEENVVAKTGRQLTLEFDEDVHEWNPGYASYPVVYRYDENVDSWSAVPRIPIDKDHYSLANNVLTITLPQDLDTGKYYGVMIPGIENTTGQDGDFIRDSFDAPFKGFDYPEAYQDLPYAGCWYFRTAATYGPPALIDQTPAAGTTEVAEDTGITMTFDQPVRSNTGTNKYVYIKKYDDDSIAAQILNTNILGAGSMSRTPTIPALSLDDSTKYYVVIDPGAFENEGGVAYAGLSDKSWDFTTVLKYHVRFFNGADQIGDTQRILPGEDAIPPADPTPSPGYVFDSWDASYENVTSDLDIHAVFKKICTLSYHAGDHGTLTGDTSQTVIEGNEGTEVTAVPDTDYHFVRWNDGVMTASRTDIAAGDLDVEAIFAYQYVLTYTAGAHGIVGGTTTQAVDPGGEGTAVTAFAVDEGYHFVQWSDGVMTARRQDTNVMADLTVQAIFEIDTFTLTYRADANGSVTGDTSQTVEYDGSGTEVKAVPNLHYHFFQWDDGVTTASRQDTNVTADIDVTAQFKIDTCTLTYLVGDHGWIDGDTPQTVDYGSGGASVTAVPDTGYHFFKWSDDVMTASRQDTGVTEDLSVTATFEINEYTLTYTAGSHGSISGVSPQTVNHGSDGSTVTAVPDTGYHFVKWSDDVMTASRTDTDVTDHIDVTAEFAINEYTLKYKAGDHGSLTGVALQTVTYGGKGTSVTAVPDTGYHFVRWSDGTTTAKRKDTNVKKNISVTAVFEADMFTVKFVDYDGSTLKTESVAYGQSAGEPKEPSRTGYLFTGWDQSVANVTKDMVVIAQYEIVKYRVAFVDYDGTLIDAQTVSYGHSATAPADPMREGYVFTGWDVDFTNVRSALTVMAQYEQETFTVTFVNHDGSVLKAEEVGYGGDATPPEVGAREGYTFAGWDTAYTDITEDVTATALYMPVEGTATVTDVEMTDDGDIIVTIDTGGLPVADVHMEGGEATLNPDGTVSIRLSGDTEPGMKDLTITLTDGTVLTQAVMIGEADIPAGSVSNGNENGLPVWVWVIIIAAAAGFISVIVWVIIKGKRL